MRAILPVTTFFAGVASTLLLVGAPPAEARGCPPSVNLPRTGSVLAKVNKVRITQARLDAHIAQLRPEAADRIVAPGTAELIDTFVVDELFYQRAAAARLHREPAVQLAMSFAARAVLSDTLIERMVEAQATEAALRSWYEAHRAEFSVPQLKVSHILVTEEAPALDLLEQLRARSDFAALARERSRDNASVAKGGKLGWIEEKKVIPEFWQGCVEAPTGVLSGPIRTRFGYHIVLVEDRREETPFDEAIPRIKAKLRRELVEQYTAQLKAEAEIVIAGG